MSDLRFSFSDPIYKFRTIVVVTQDMEKWDKKYPNADSDGDPCDALFVRLSGKRALIIIKPNSPLDDLQHEIGHAARAVMQHIGFKIEPQNDEPLAYYEGYLTRKIHAGLKKLKPVDKRKKRA